MMKEEIINLRSNIKLVGFETKHGIYVYQDNILLGAIAKSQLVRIVKPI